jgi:hypothetical protein
VLWRVAIDEHRTVRHEKQRRVIGSTQGVGEGIPSTLRDVQKQDTVIQEQRHCRKNNPLTISKNSKTAAIKFRPSSP